MKQIKANFVKEFETISTENKFVFPTVQKLKLFLIPNSTSSDTKIDVKHILECFRSKKKLDDPFVSIMLSYMYVYIIRIQGLLLFFSYIAGIENSSWNFKIVMYIPSKFIKFVYSLKLISHLFKYERNIYVICLIRNPISIPG